jgi:hypothetical protein
MTPLRSRAVTGEKFRHGERAVLDETLDIFAQHHRVGHWKDWYALEFLDKPSSKLERAKGFEPSTPTLARCPRAFVPLRRASPVYEI